MFEPFVIVVSRKEVEDGDISPALDILKRFMETPDIARSYKEKVDIAFHGYDGVSEELFEIPEVRNYVYKLDEQFPYWLYFLSKQYLGLQALLFCFLPPYLTAEARAVIFPQRIYTLLTNRWLPAMNQICAFVGMSDNENEILTERSIKYITHGRFLSENYT